MKPFIAAFIFAILTIYAIKFIKNNFSFAYFSFTHIIDPEEKDLNLLGLITIFLPPFIGNIILAVLFYRIEYCIIYGFLTSFLVIWPVISKPHELLTERVYPKRKALYFIYFTYVFIYTLISIGSYNLIIYISKSQIVSNIKIDNLLNSYNEFHPLYQSIISNLASQIIWVIAVAILVFLYAKARSKLLSESNEEKSNATETEQQ